MKKHIAVIVFVFFTISSVLGQDYDEKFNPDKLNDYQPEWPVVVNQTTESRINENPISGNKYESSEINGYRIQLLATTSATEADSFIVDIRKLIGDEIYIIFEAPNYKVRMGNYQHRSIAQRSLDKIHAMGYRQAWVVRTRIDLVKN